MSGRKRQRVASSSSEAGSSSTSGEPKKRAVQRRTVEKWISELDREFDTSLWLKFDMADREHVALLKCSICSQFSDKLDSMRNFRPAFINGTANIRVSTVKDHAATDMHARAMLLLKKQQSSNVVEYAPIARCFAHASIDEATREKIKKKVDIAYMIAKEKMAFTKMKPICELQERHGVNLGNGYKTDRACASFIEFIAREQQEILLTKLSGSKFFSFLADASTDAGNIEVELFLILYFDAFASDCKVHVRSKFFASRHLGSGTGEGLFESLKTAVEYVGVDDWKTKLIGFGCDGASANMAEGGGLLQANFPWIFVFWCLAHRLELSIKDALKSTFFSTIDNLLLRMYYIYEKSPKKCRELEDIADELKACLEPTEMSLKGGIRPLRSCGTRFVAHKVAALERVVERFGAYLAHLIGMTEDTSMKAADRQKMKGYVLNWQNSQVLLACAVFRDLLKPVSILCKVLQDNEICVVRAIDSICKTKNSLDKLKSTTFEELPTVKKVIGRIKEEDECVSYQGVDLKRHSQAITYLKSHIEGWIEAMETCLRSRIRSNEVDFLTHAVTLLATNGWERTESPSFGYAALEAICKRFAVPLEGSNVDCSLVQEEWDDMVDYGKRFLNLVQDDYRVNWWKIFNAVDAKKWTNVLTLVELLFCLPVSNGHLEQVFSQIKLIKTNRRTCLGENTLDQLIRINVEAPPLSEWDASCALDLWLQDKTRRLNRASSSRSTHSKSTTPGDNDSPSGDNGSDFTLEGWEEWIGAVDSNSN